MREIKFRGKRIDNGEWVYGYYVQTPTGEHRIYWNPFDEATMNTYHKVDPETVGQYTGLKDKNGKEIYEGDILKGYSRHLKDWQFKEVVWDHSGWEISPRIGFTFSSDFEVIGNIYENPELIK